MVRRLGRLHRQRGAVAVEFALVLPLLLLLVLGGIDWGYYFFVGEIAGNAAREAARSAALMPGAIADPCTTAPAGMATAINVAKNYMQRGGLISGPADTRLKPFDASCTGSTNSCCDANTTITGFSDVVVRVTVRYQVRAGSMSLTGFMPASLLPTAVVATATMRREP